MNRSLSLFIILLTSIAGTSVTKPAGSWQDKQLRNEVITGRVILEDGSSAEGARIHIIRAGIKQDMLHNTRQIFNTDNEGNFKATGLVPGVYRLNVFFPGYVPSSRTFDSDLHRIGEQVMINMVKGGVITGTVTDARGQSLIGGRVLACRVRDAEGIPLFEQRRYSESAFTDDRGIYRIYGLYPGNYVIRISSGFSDGDAPIYHPSSTRAGAAEITVHPGEEITGINIQSRSQPAFAVTGILSGEVDTAYLSSAPRIALVNNNSGDLEYEISPSNSNRFVFYGVADGDYELFAYRSSDLRGNSGSTPVRIQVRSADLTGIELKLFKFGSISGRVTIEGSGSRAVPSANPCQSKEKPGVNEIYLSARNDGPKNRLKNPFFDSDDNFSNSRIGILNEKWEFSLNNLEPGRYHIETNLPGENWYIRAIKQPAPGKVKGLTDVSGAGIALKRSDNLAGIEVSLADGAAGLSGRLDYGNDHQAAANKMPLSRYRVHLIPAENEDAENALRYAEAPAGSGGTFAFKNLAPGKYRIMAKPLQESESVEAQARPAAWDADERAKLRRDAEKNIIELQPCQRMSDRVIRVNLR
jgi:carboxypeptidase family protein